MIDAYFRVGQICVAGRVTDRMSGSMGTSREYLAGQVLRVLIIMPHG